MDSRLIHAMVIVRCLALAAGIVIFSYSVEGAITIDQLQAQATATEGALLQYSIAKDEQAALVPLADAAWVRWQQLRELAILYYGAGNFNRGDYYQLAAVAEQATYDRLIVAIQTKMGDVEAKWQTYRREFERLQAMIAAYRSQ